MGPALKGQPDLGLPLRPQHPGLPLFQSALVRMVNPGPKPLANIGRHFVAEHSANDVLHTCRRREPKTENRKLPWKGLTASLHSISFTR
jgi:hypothetical protein